MATFQSSFVVFSTVLLSYRDHKVEFLEKKVCVVKTQQLLPFYCKEKVKHLCVNIVNNV